jgi:dolichol-phosphate mannosyltransferase
MSRTALFPGRGRALAARHGTRFLQFALVGLSGVVVNTVLLYMLVSHAGWPHLPAAACSSEAAMISNFALNDRWTFRDAAPAALWPGRFLRYNAIALGGVAISLGVLAILTMLAGMHYLLANLVGIVAGTLWNYGVNILYTWNIRAAGQARIDLAATTEG